MTRIRAADRSEWRRVRELRLRALADAPDAFGSTYERERSYGRRGWVRWISGPRGSTNGLFVAEDGEAWLGMAVGSLRRGDRRAHLYAMWVEPGSRRGGIGRALVEAVLAWARGAGASEIELGVTATNAAARRFYEGLGFADGGEHHPLREGSELAVVVMRRPLDP